MRSDVQASDPGPEIQASLVNQYVIAELAKEDESTCSGGRTDCAADDGGPPGTDEPDEPGTWKSRSWI
jgi:hypothetical protein